MPMNCCIPPPTIPCGADDSNKDLLFFISVVSSIIGYQTTDDVVFG